MGTGISIPEEKEVMAERSFELEIGERVERLPGTTTTLALDERDNEETREDLGQPISRPFLLLPDVVIKEGTAAEKERLSAGSSNKDMSTLARIKRDKTLNTSRKRIRAELGYDTATSEDQSRLLTTSLIETRMRTRTRLLDKTPLTGTMMTSSPSQLLNFEPTAGKSRLTKSTRKHINHSSPSGFANDDDDDDGDDIEESPRRDVNDGPRIIVNDEDVMMLMRARRREYISSNQEIKLITPTTTTTTTTAKTIVGEQTTMMTNKEENVDKPSDITTSTVTGTNSMAMATTNTITTTATCLGKNEKKKKRKNRMRQKGNAIDDLFRNII